MGGKQINRSYRVPIIYCVFSVLWILFSDRIAFATSPSLETANLYSTIKGLVFVLISTVLIFFLIRADETRKAKLLNEIVAVQRSFNLLFEDNPQPMWIFENKTLEIMAVNSAACRKYGYSADEFCKLKILDLVTDEQIPAVFKTISDHRDELRHSGPWEHVKKDGEHIMVQVVAHQLRSVGFNSTLVSIVDVTEQQKTLDVLGTTMQERDDFEFFGFTASHDLKAHLRAIIGYSEILENEYKKDLNEEGLSFVRQINKAGHAMNVMLDDMMVLTKISRKSLEFQQLNLSEIFTETVKTLKIQEPDRQIEISIQQNMTVTGDNGAIQLIVLNLLQNAWKYTKKTEHAWIKVGSFIDENEKEVFFVKDNGVGFDAANAEKIFEPFARGHANSSFDGMGIGLSVVRRAVERHNGRVWAESEPDKGASFFFTLG